MCEQNRLFWIVREKNAKWNQGIEPPGRMEVWVRMIADATNSVDTWRLDEDLSTRADWSRTGERSPCTPAAAAPPTTNLIGDVLLWFPSGNDHLHHCRPQPGAQRVSARPAPFALPADLPRC